MNVNYNLEMEKIIAAESGKHKKLLLHACCAPCLSGCLDRVKNAFDTSVLFYNPNMDGIEEYEKRRAEAERFATLQGVNFFSEKYRPDDFYSAVNGLENEPEGGKRCLACFRLRLNHAALLAKENGFDYFATTLTLSPLKNAEKLNEAGFAAEKEFCVKYLPSDFKKRGGYQLSIAMSAQYGLYRQNYCGCEFSARLKP